jgi:hypothetical protein
MGSFCLKLHALRFSLPQPRTVDVEIAIYSELCIRSKLPDSQDLNVPEGGKCRCNRELLPSMPRFIPIRIRSNACLAFAWK